MGIINMKLTSRLYILSAIDLKEIEGLKSEKLCILRLLVTHNIL